MSWSPELLWNERLDMKECIKYNIECHRKSGNEQGREELLCEVKTAIWCWDWREVEFVGAHESSFPCYFCAVVAGNGESVKNRCTVMIVEGIIPFAEWRLVLPNTCDICTTHSSIIILMNSFHCILYHASFFIPISFVWIVCLSSAYFSYGIVAISNKMLIIEIKTTWNSYVFGDRKETTKQGHVNLIRRRGVTLVLLRILSRAGVMSRNEGRKDKRLLTWAVFLSEKAIPL